MERLVPGCCPVIYSQESLDEGHCLSREGCWKPGCEMRAFPRGSWQCQDGGLLWCESDLSEGPEVWIGLSGCGVETATSVVSVARITL